MDGPRDENPRVGKRVNYSPHEYEFIYSLLATVLAAQQADYCSRVTRRTPLPGVPPRGLTYP